MKLMTVCSASKVPGSPSRVYLGRLAKKENRPNYFVDMPDGVQIDISHADWVDMISNRKPSPQAKKKPQPIKKNPVKKKEPQVKSVVDKKKTPKTKPNVEYYTPQSSEEKPVKKKPQPKKTVKADSGVVVVPETGDLEYDLRLRKIAADINEKEKKTEILHLQLKKKSASVLDYDIASYLFFSFIEKASIDFLRMAKKNEAKIFNYHKENNPKKTMSLINNEVTAILREMQRAQEESLNKWLEEEGIK